MKNKTKIIIGYGLIMMLFIGLVGPMQANELNSETELEISAIEGGMGKVTLEIANIGEVIAEDISSSISVKGGLLNKIDIYHECSGCSSCGTTLDPGATKTESTSEVGIIFGFGPVEISVMADATNADQVTQTTNGFVFGLFVIVN